MTQYIDELIAIGEGYQLEFKENIDKSIAKEVCAFANASGGKILIGVKDNGKKQAIVVDNNLLSRIQDTINQIEPRIDVNIIKGDGILIIEVPSGLLKPYTCAEGFFLRIGPNSQKLKRDAIMDMFRRGGAIKFDLEEHQKANFEKDFDLVAYKQFLSKAGISNKISPKHVLRNLGCMTNHGKFTNAGVLFFTKSIEFLLRQGVCTCILYKGVNKVKILDRKDYSTNMLDNIDNAASFVSRHTNLEYVIEHIMREEIPEVPEIALREAIINAFCHKYYFEDGSNIMVEVFDDRVDITSFGGLPAGLRTEDFGVMSVQRNALIADLLGKVHYIEKAGTGIQRIKDAVAELGKGEIKFKYNENWFVTTFTRTTSTSNGRSSEEVRKKFGRSSEEVRKKFGRSSEESINLPQLKLNAKNDTQQIISDQVMAKVGNASAILTLIKTDSKITAQKIAVELGITSRSVEKQLAVLKQFQVIKRVGSTKGGFWQILLDWS